MQKSRSGFTIIELLIVIVVIAILAAITIVAFNGVQSRARDASIDSAANQVLKAYNIWTSTSGKSPVETGYGWPGAGGVATGAGYIFLNYVGTSNTLDLFVSQNLLPRNFLTNLPPNKTHGNSSDYTFMAYPCGTSTQWVLLWYAENNTTKTDQEYQTTLQQCYGPDFDALGHSNYTISGMRRAKMFN